MTNDQMKPNRYYKWALARKKLAFMTTQVNAGNTVYLATMLRVTKVSKAAHLAAFTATRSGLYMVSGKSKVCMDGCRISAQ